MFKTWSISRLIAFSALAWFLAVAGADAHIGSPTVFFEGTAGPYQLRVVVRPPGVVPGLAQISVRVLNGTSNRVYALPVRYDAGTKGAPSPDELKPLRDEPNHFSGELWLMTSGSFSIFVDVEGPQGKGTTVVPLNSVASRTLQMGRGMGAALLAMGVFLLITLAAIAGAAVRESTLPVGARPDIKRRRWSVAATILALFLSSALVWGGHKWWTSVDSDYRNNRVYKPDPIKTKIVQSDARPVLVLERPEPKWGRRPLIPEHGKIMHVFLIGEDLRAMAHLHPTPTGSNTFQAALPPLPAGSYRCYADITHENGFTQTLVSRISLSTNGMETTGASTTDPDDSWHVGDFEATPAGFSEHPRAVATTWPGGRILWLPPERTAPDAEIALKFLVVGADNRPSPLEPYLGMQAHAVIQHVDGSVFTHLHPFGTISMASQEMFVRKEKEVAPNRRTLDIVCGLPSQENWISFPYAFPKPGKYRIWLQAKTGGRVITGAFDGEVVGVTGL